MLTNKPTSFAGRALTLAPGTTSGYKGVTKHGDGWEVRTAGRKRKCLGTYKDPVEAAYVLAMHEDENKEDANPQGKLALNAGYVEGESRASHLCHAAIPS